MATGDSSPSRDTRRVELLLACLHRDPHRLRLDALSLLDGHGWRDLVDAAYRLGVAERLYGSLLARGQAEVIPPPIRAELMDRCRTTAAANARLLGQLEHVLAALDRGGVEAVWLKGVLLALDIHAHLAWRPAGDIDLLVRRTDLDRAAAILQADGYRPRREYSVAAVVAHTHHLPPFAMRGRTSVELHWTILPPSPRYAVRPDELFTHAVPCSVGTARTLGLAPDHLLLHQCLHASYRHLFAGGLGPVCDIAGVIERHGSTLDWDALAATAQRWRVAPGVSGALRVASDLVGAAVPAAALDELGPVDPAILATCRAQMLSVVGSSDRATMSAELPRLLSGSGASGRRELLMRRLFPSRAEVATLYGIDAGSARVFPYYVVRAMDLVARHWRYLPAYVGVGGDAGVAAFAVRQGRLAGWLSHDEGGRAWR